ncbi:MAG: ABC transporter ATP-binding protein [Kurthia sp.]|nr:ABC transporter ATP-binding protein [Candidatus Kurthia equi]
MINVQNVSYGIKSKCILKNVSFQIPIGKIIAIAGENGSGKTTLLRLLSGIKNPSNGKITIDHKPLTHQSANTIAYLPDTDNFHSNLTGVQLFHYYQSQFTDFNLGKANEIAAFLEVELQQKIRNLSKGQRGRLKMAATLAREVPYYILDEPLAGLDPIVRESLIRGLIKFTDTEKQTIILSTHELYEVEPILDALLLLKDTRIISYDMLENIREQWQEDAVSWMKKQYRKE